MYETLPYPWVQETPYFKVLCAVQLPLALSFIRKQMDLGKEENGVSHLNCQGIERENGRVRNVLESSNHSEEHVANFVRSSLYSMVYRLVEQPLSWQGEVKARVQLASVVESKCCDRAMRDFMRSTRSVSGDLR